ncbi:hypothetical protein MXB_4395 [Myxobolus squamalis]|nr:hypothetical protein MXB_4395 [Myxobolus squamalis]
MLTKLLKLRRFYGESIIKDKVFAYIGDKVELPKLPYGYKDLEPVLSEEIMQLHHLKHHQNYISKYLENSKLYDAANSPAEIEILLRRVNFNGGGYINHTLYWNSLVPPSKAHEPTDQLFDLIKRDFGGTDKLIRNIKTLSADVQGSGWVWLGYNKCNDKLFLVPTENQDILAMKTGLIPLLGIDLWEHAYYLQYKNDRSAYVNSVLNSKNM